MKLNLALAFLLTLSLSLFIFSSGSGKGSTASPAPQFGGQCQQFGPNQSDECGTGFCGYGPTYQYSNGFTSGSGIQSLALRTHTCKGQNENGDCVDSQAEHYIAENDSSCCDQDHDGYSRTACGGSDCNDANYYVNPGRPELCNDDIDNNCNGAADCEEYICSFDPPCCKNAGESCLSGICCSGLTCNESNVCEGCIPPCTGEFVCFNNLCGYTPVIVDVLGNGISLTDGAGGVDFDFNDDGVKGRLSWTLPNSDDAWLVLDRNANGVIDGGRELFGSTTPQLPPPSGEPRNGFLALAEFDKPASGGDGDGRIGPRDAVHSALRLWQDTNHNGLTDAGELHSLHDLGLKYIFIDYKESKRTDRHGNRFRYRAKVKDAKDTNIGRWAWDVFLVQ